jgi:basic amino acid/polyamine antiporter, APA family
MAQISRKLNFWSVFALVTGSQIGSGVFMLPANLAPYGLYSLCGWLISGLGAIMLALVFAKLCSWLPKTGGPHVYIKEAFGNTAAFFTGWTYWVVSWVSTTVVIIASIGYLTPLIGDQSVIINVLLEIVLLLGITFLNFRGVGVAGRAEFLLSLVKIIPLGLVPLIALFYFNINNFVLSPSLAPLPLSSLLSQVTLLTLWGFIGLESATTPAESVENPATTIPRAVVLGTASVALLYLLNSTGIMGVIPGQELMHSNAPYADTVRYIFGGNWHLIISVIASLICIGTLNAWTLTSGQISLGLAQDGLLPAIFGKKNMYDAPQFGLIISCLGIIPLLIITANASLARQVLAIIDFSVTAFLFVYAFCCLAFFKILFQRIRQGSEKLLPLLYGGIAFIFCCWVIYETPLTTLVIASLFIVSGIPLYFYRSYTMSKRNI